MSPVRRLFRPLLVPVALLALGCSLAPESRAADSPVKIEKGEFGKGPEGQPVGSWTLTNSKGTSVRLIEYGAICQSLKIADRDGKFADVVLGCESVEAYRTSPYFGAVVGRYANRIGEGTFRLDGKIYKLAKNNAPNHLHGGEVGFNNVMWRGEAFSGEDRAGVRFSYNSVDGEEGYPGNLACVATYTLTEDDELILEYEATTDAPTVVNLTQHNYYNLAGQGEGDILGHELKLFASNYTPGDATLIPTGAIDPVEGTPLDFREPTAIGARIDKVEGGYDHNFCIDGWEAPAKGKKAEMRPAAKIRDPKSGRTMEISTTEPGIQFYSGNFLDGTITGKDGKVYGKHYGFCLETQKYPDTPNKADFPSAVLRPGETYRHRTVHKFSAE